MRVITICGSLRFEQEMKYYTEKMELEGNCVLSMYCISIKGKRRIYTRRNNFFENWAF